MDLLNAVTLESNSQIKINFNGSVFIHGFYPVPESIAVGRFFLHFYVALSRVASVFHLLRKYGFSYEKNILL